VTVLEIRTPMNGICGSAELLLDTELSEKQRELVSLIKKSADLMLVLINDILDYSKIEAGKFELQMNPFNLSTAVEDVVELLSESALNKNISLHYLIPSAEIIADPGRIRQVLVNLIGNAIKFTNVGKIVIRCEMKEIENDSVCFLFRVSDTGIGMTEEEISRLFKPFSQVDSSFTKRYQGTGLGLAISKQIVNLLGGDIGVELRLEKDPRFGSILKPKNQTQNKNYSIILLL